MNSIELLREYVMTLLKEEGDYGYSGDASSMMGTMGYNEYGPSLKKIFIDPFLDVGKTATAAVAHMGVRTKSLLKIGTETVLTTFIPFMESNYKMIFDHEKKDLARIRDKYKDVFAVNSKAFTKDVMLLSFMISPTAFISTKLISNSPDLAVHVLEVLSHGNDSLKQYVEDIKKRLQNIEKELKDDIANYRKVNPERYVDTKVRGPYFTKKKRDLLQKAGINDSHDRGNAILQEAVSNAEQAKIDLLSEVFADPRVKSMLEQSSMTKQMQNDAKQITAKISSAIYNEAQKVMSARSIEELERLTKKNFGVAQKLQQAPENERQQLEEAMLMQVKAATKAFYVKQLTTEIQTLQNQGIDSTNIYIRTLQGTLDKVASLK